jgi:thiamine biosynthesis lipoprotein
MSHQPAGDLSVESLAGFVRARWYALGGPCELLVAGDDVALARRLAALASAEAWRIERTFSRYRDDSVLHAIHASAGAPITVDDETAALLDYAAECHALSDGAFDITSGVLRHAWRFDGGTQVPDAVTVQALIARVGWSRDPLGAAGAPSARGHGTGSRRHR